MCDVLGPICVPAVGDGREVWAIGFRKHSVGGTQLGCFLQVGCSLERHDAAEAEVRAQVEAATGFFGSTREAVKDCALRCSFGGEDVESVVPRVARMHHQRQLALVRDLNLCGERDALVFTGRVFVEVVESRLAHRDHIDVVEEVADGVDAVTGLVRMQAEVAYTPS